jgi:hypothetical protein
MKRRFNVDISRIRTDLERTAEKLGFKKVTLLRAKDGRGALVRLTGSTVKNLSCRRFDNSDDNLRAIGLTLEYQRRIREEYGAELVKAAAAVVLPNSGLLNRPRA